MYWRYFSLSLIALYFQASGLLWAQTEAHDSIERARLMNIGGEEHARILNRYAYELRETDPQSALSMVQEVISLSEKSENIRELAIAYSTLGFIQNGLNEFTASLNSYLKANEIYRVLGIEKEIGELTYPISSLYKTLGDYARSIEYCHEGLRIFEESNNLNGLASIYRVMGSVYKYQKDYEKSLYYYFEGLRINNEIGNEQGIANSYNNIGIVYFEMKDYNEALNFYKKSLKLNITNEVKSEYAINCGNIGEVYLTMGLSDSAIIYFNKHYEAVIELNNRKGIASSFRNYGNYYYNLNENKLAIEYYQKSLELSRKLGILETTKNVLFSLSNLYLKLDDNKQALIYFKSYIDVRDSLINNETLQKISKLEMEYTSEKEKAEHLLSEEKSKLQNVVVFSALLIFTLFMIIAYMLQKNKLKRRTLDQKKLEMDKRQLQNEVYYKNNELTTKAIYLAERNEFINELSLKLYKLIHNPESTEKGLKSIIKDLENHSNLGIWTEFEFTFLKVHPEFYYNLGARFPDLTPNEKRLSALLRLNLSTKDISNITHQSLHSLTVARTRLRKKLGMANSGENLTTFLSQF